MAKRTCSFERCDLEHYGRGWCQTHYNQWYRGEEVRPIMAHMTLKERFLTKVSPGEASKCWRWGGSMHKYGYGVLSYQHKNLPAHRVSYELFCGEIPAGSVVDHKCRNRWCVNPSHLHTVTHKQNVENTGDYSNSRYGRGVSRRSNGKFRVRVGHNGEILHIGDFDRLEDAQEAVVRARLKYHTNNLIDRGEFYG